MPFKIVKWNSYLYFNPDLLNCTGSIRFNYWINVDLVRKSLLKKQFFKGIWGFIPEQDRFVFGNWYRPTLFLELFLLSPHVPRLVVSYLKGHFTVKIRNYQSQWYLLFYIFYFTPWFFIIVEFVHGIKMLTAK